MNFSSFANRFKFELNLVWFKIYKKKGLKIIQNLIKKKSFEIVLKF